MAAGRASSTRCAETGTKTDSLTQALTIWGDIGMAWSTSRTCTFLDPIVGTLAVAVDLLLLVLQHKPESSESFQLVLVALPCFPRKP